MRSSDVETGVARWVVTERPALYRGPVRRLISLAAAAFLAVSGSAAANAAPRLLTAGFAHSCAILSGTLECWGDNASGELGDGTTVDRLRPVAVTGLPAAPEWLAPGSQADHTCAVLVGGKLTCWGENGVGQLGNGTQTDSVTPVTVPGLTSGVQDAGLGLAQTCAVTGAGGAECWGLNLFGKLGDGTETPRPTPGPVSGLSSGVRSIVAGAFHTCALLNTGGVVCWGWNVSGELGNPSCVFQCFAPLPVVGLSSGVEQISAGSGHTCALLTGGSVRCWGRNGYGQLGDGTTKDRPTPITPSKLTSGVVAIGTGSVHSCALLSTGKVECWGENDVGQLGDGTHLDRHRPVTARAVSDGRELAVGSDHGCILRAAGGFTCWGSNHHGQLGNGRHTNELELHLKGRGSVTGLGFRCLSGGNEYCFTERAPGAALHLEATAAKGWRLQRWSGRCKRRPRCTVRLAKDLTVVATFKKRHK